MSRCAVRRLVSSRRLEPPQVSAARPSQGGAGRSVWARRATRGVWGLARLLLSVTIVAGLASCLPPDFEIDTAVNRPIKIDKSLLTINPDRFIDVSNCQNLTFDVTTAVSDPDGDPIETVWLVNYEPGLGTQPDAVGFLRYTFRPCSSLLVPGVPLTLELFVLDRRPLSFDDADEAKTIVDPATTTDNVVWFIGADALACCPGGN